MLTTLSQWLSPMHFWSPFSAFLFYHKQKNGGTCKNGIYFIYDENENILYVGMVSDKKTASLKARFYDNGNSAHCNKYWFEKYAKFYRFYSFPKASEAELELIERLMIYINNQPVYNDKDTSESANDFEFILKKL